MGRISDEDIQRVRDATDIVQLISESVLLKQRGRLWWGNCPFHQEKTPSFKVDPTTQLWHCFGCGAGGDAFGFVMQSQGLDFPDAVRWLAERARIEIREEEGGAPTGAKERLRSACEAAAAFYHRVLTTDRSTEAQAAREYLSSRGFSSDVAKRWNLGFAPSNGHALVRHLGDLGFSRDELLGAGLAVANAGERLRDRFIGRVMFPIADIHGRVIAFGGRVVERIGGTGPKYLNSAETPIFVKAANLYGIDKARNPIVVSGTAVVVEGYTDVIALHEAGISTAVATLGTALGERHVRLLARFAKRIVYLFDGDEAGLRAADRALEFLDWSATPEAGRARVDFAVGIVPGGLDPADFVAERGAGAMQAVIDSAVPLVRYALDRRIQKHDVATPEGKAAALAEAADVLARVGTSIIAEEYARYVADRLLVDPVTVLGALRSQQRNKRAAAPHVTPDESEPHVDRGAEMSPAERALVALVAMHPRIRPAARELLAEDIGEQIVGSGTRRLLDAVLASGGADGPDLVARVRDAVPEAVPILSAVLVDAPDVEEVEYAFHEIACRLKESALERLILRKKARLRELEPAKDAAAYEEAFRELVEIQRAHAAVKQVRERGHEKTE
ncbi:DNA primase [Coriobacteriia bacterium Es71-Z0120]|uniref:DNA primase n=1 Tax=Parvivirga hydrogeniphila TaxID=2939460 RepID=UPI0022609F4F|nr:DNA primase [Parvivirga hydrogeniphila]MCL4079008.1 DNA primase [Parvivirga hydrogeniphila]